MKFENSQKESHKGSIKDKRKLLKIEREPYVLGPEKLFITLSSDSQPVDDPFDCDADVACRVAADRTTPKALSRVLHIVLVSRLGEGSSGEFLCSLSL